MLGCTMVFGFFDFRVRYLPNSLCEGVGSVMVLFSLAVVGRGELDWGRPVGWSVGRGCFVASVFLIFLELSWKNRGSHIENVRSEVGDTT